MINEERKKEIAIINSNRKSNGKLSRNEITIMQSDMKGSRKPRNKRERNKWKNPSQTDTRDRWRLFFKQQQIFMPIRQCGLRSNVKESFSGEIF